MKKPLALIITDTHLHINNISLVESIFDQVIEICRDNSIGEIYHMGDWFTNRAGQPLEVLISTLSIVNKFKENKIKCYVIPGNHDKKNTNSVESYLDVFSNSNFIVCPIGRLFDYNNICFHLLPYFQEGGDYFQKLENQKENIQNNKKNILLTHIAVNGVKNNDGTGVENNLNQKMFSCFDKVLVGHYHNRSQVGDNIFYIGSAYASNYGEDNDKGCVIVDTSGDIEYIQLDFPKFIKYDINADELTTKDITQLKKEKGDDNLRIVVKGSKEKLKVFDRTILTDIGVDCKLQSEEIEKSFEEAENNEFESYTNQSILNEFESFCKEKKHDLKTGKKYLEQIIVK